MTMFDKSPFHELMKQFPIVSLVVMSSKMNIIMNLNKCVHKQTNKRQTDNQTCMEMQKE